LTLVCVTAQTPVGRAGSLRRNVNASPQFWDSGGGGPYIYRMDADGKSQKPLTDEGGAAQPSWSPDGTQIVFNGGHKDSTDVQLYLIPSTSESVRWTQLTFGEPQKSSPSWSRSLGR
jgi:Tol biopolymer transport system component